MLESFDKNNLDQAGDFNLDVCNLISYRRDDENGTQFEMDIKQVVQVVSLTEDIFNKTITGQVILYDAQDVRTMLPITGLEKLELKFSTPGFSGVNAVRGEGHPFQVYKIEKVKVDSANPNASQYAIFFGSSEDYYNSFNRVSQAFSGSLENGVETILRSKDYLNSKKRFFYEPTKTRTKIVAPNRKPFGTIEMISSMAQSQKYHTGGYLFYENVDGFHFRSIESLLALDGTKPRPATFNYVYQVTGAAENDNGNKVAVRNVVKDLESVQSYEFYRPANFLYNMNEGMFASKLITHDSFYKQVKEFNYDYNKDFYKSYHLETDGDEPSALKSVLPLHGYEDTRTPVSENSMAKLMTYCDNQKIHNEYEFPPLKDTIQSRLSQRLSLLNVNVSLVVPGNSLLRAGDIINFDLPLQRPVLDTNKSSNPYYSGRYLVMSILHTVDRESGKYQMVLKCAKDSTVTELPAESRTFTIDTKQEGVENIYNSDKRFTTDAGGRLLGGV